MSGTTTAPAETLWTPQTVIALVLLAIGAATIAGVFVKGDAATINTIAGIVIGATIGGVSGFFFGSSKSSQSKDETMATIAQQKTGAPIP